jgi:hypothetical protein
MAPGYRVLAAASIAALSLLACDDEPAETSTPTPTPSQAASPSATATATTQPAPSPTPVTLESAAGPLFYYVADTGSQDSLVVVDLATSTRVVERPLGERESVKLAGSTLISLPGEDPFRVVELDPAGAPVRTLFESDLFIGDAAVSPDGSRLAVVTYRERVVIVDWATLATIASLAQTDLPAAVEDGGLAPVRWVDDSEHVVLDLVVERDGCGPGHVVLGVDGDFRFYQNRGCNHTSPNGRLMADPGGYGCFLVGDDELQIVDSVTGVQISRYVEPDTILQPWSWSPDSTEVLVQRGYVPDRFNPSDPAEDCAFTESAELADSFAWAVVDVATGDLSPVTDLDTLHARWHPERRIQLVCDGETEELLLSRGGNRSARCEESFVGTITVDGVAVGEASAIEVLGFVER